MRLTKQQILSIPELIDKHQSYSGVAHELGVSERAIGYWIKKLRSLGTKVNIRKGPIPMLETKD